MRQLLYGVAMSLDGYIAGPNGEFDWIPHDPEIDFAEIFSRFDTLLMGRKTFEITHKAPQTDNPTDPQYEGGAHPGMRTVVVSRRLKPEDYPRVTIINDRVAEAVAELKAKPGKDIWLFGGGELFGSLLDLGLVDRIEVAVVPVLLGSGIPFIAGAATKRVLRFEKQQVYKNSGIVALEYALA